MSSITKTKESFGWIDGNLTEAQGGRPAVTIASLLISASAAEWSAFEANYGTTGSLIKALNDAWDHGGGTGPASLSVEVITEATYEILSTDVNTFFTFVNPVAGDSIYVSLPRAVDAGEGALIDILVAGIMVGESTTGTFSISTPEGDSFIWTNGDHAATILGTTQDYSKITLISDGVSTWGVYNAYGWWGDCEFGEGGTVYFSKFMFSGNIKGSTEDDIVTFDADGNIKDSGVSITQINPNVEVVTAATYEILFSEVGTFFSFVNPVPGEHVRVTLPLAADVAEGASLEILVAGPMIDPGVATGTFAIDVAEGDSIVWTNGDHAATTLGTSQDYSKITLVSDGATSWWISNGYGWWGEAAFGEGGVAYDSKYVYSGCLTASTEDNIVTFDADGNIKDSGVGIGAVALAVETITDDAYEILYTQKGTAFSFVNPVPGESVLITLPLAADAGEGALLDLLVAGPMIDPGVATGHFVISTVEEDYFIWTNGDHTAVKLGTTQDYSKITLISDGVSSWGVHNAYGWWGDCYNNEGSWLYSSKFMFSSYLPGSTEDNVVTIDAYGNIKDSGTAIGDLGGGGTPTVVPKTDSYPVVVGDANNTVFTMSAATAKTFTLEASPAADRYLIFVNKGAGTCTVDGNGKHINNEDTWLLGTYESITIIYDGSEWLIL